MRVYLVGAGFIARTHAEASRKLPEAVDLRVADAHPAALARFLQAYPGVPAFAGAEEMLTSETALDDDVVIIATPPCAHLAPTVLALRSGRHVLTEKPLAMSTDEADEMLRVAQDSDRMLGCCSVRFQASPAMEAVKQVLAGGDLGDVYHVTFVHKLQRSRAGIEYQPSSRWFLDSTRSGGGVLMDWGPYDFATLTDVLQPSEVEVLAAWLAKPCTQIDPEDVRFDVETHVGALMTLRYRDGRRPVAVQYERASGTHGEEHTRVEIEGTLGSVSWAPFDSRRPVTMRRDRDGTTVEEQVTTGPGPEHTVFDHPLLDFYRKVRGLDGPVDAGERAVDRFRWLRALYRCARTGERQVVMMHPAEEVAA